MNQNDINHAFTEKVSDLLAQGYQICPGTMNGSQGEIAHVDLCKGEEIIRILLDRFCGCGETPDGLQLIVSAFRMGQLARCSSSYCLMQ